MKRKKIQMPKPRDPNAVNLSCRNRVMIERQDRKSERSRQKASLRKGDYQQMCIAA